MADAVETLIYTSHMVCVWFYNSIAYALCQVLHELYFIVSYSLINCLKYVYATVARMPRMGYYEYSLK